MSDPKHPYAENPENLVLSDDGLKEKYWDPAWGEGAAPDGVSRMDHGDA